MHFMRASFLVLVSLFLICSTSIQAKSILGCATVGARSHHMNVLKIGKELTDRDHDFTMLVSSTDSISLDTVGARGFPGLRVVQFKGPQADLAPGTELWAASLTRDPKKSIRQLVHGHKLAAEALYTDNHTLKQLQAAGFDMMLRDATAWPCEVLSDTLGLPSVDVLPVAPSPFFAKHQEFPNPVAYIPQLVAEYSSDMTFLQRVQNYAMSMAIAVIVRMFKKDETNFAEKIGQEMQSIRTGVASSAALIVTADWALEYPQPMPPRVHLVGPLLAEDAKPLDLELNVFVESGLRQGHAAVFVSMGTLARMTDEEVHSMAAGLSAFPNPVLWKLDSSYLQGDTSVANLSLGSNIKLVDWAPQNDVLGHPAVKAFVTHAGINSVYEAAYHAKPVVAVPLIADQPENAVKISYHGFGVILKPGKMVEGGGKPLQEALQHVLADPSFQGNAVKVAKRLQNKTRHPVQLAADIVERAIATGGELYLQTRQHTLSWWQLSLLDVKAFLILVAVLGLSVLALAIRFVWIMVARITKYAKSARSKQKYS